MLEIYCSGFSNRSTRDRRAIAVASRDTPTCRCRAVNEAAIRYMTERPLSAGDSEEGSPIGWLFVVVGALSGAYFTSSKSPSPVKARLPIAFTKAIAQLGDKKMEVAAGGHLRTRTYCARLRQGSVDHR